MTDTKRREFLRRAVAMPLAASAFLCGTPMRIGARAAGAHGKALVVIFLRGGCDGLNTIVPYADARYYDLRPGIAVAPPGPGGAIDLDGYFGLHPSLAPLASLYAGNRLAILPAVHYAAASRSHFTNQYQIESAMEDGSPSGWMNRYLAATTGSSAMPAVALGSRLPHALQGDVAVPVFPDLGNNALGGQADRVEAFIDRFRAVYSQPLGPGATTRRRIHQSGLAMLDDLDAVARLDAAGYVAANGAVYPDSPLGHQLRQAALLIKSGIGVELVNIDYGGWDTHASQGGGEADGEQSRLLAGLATAVQAFHQDLGAKMDDVMLLTMTEFGRNAAENASGGTDHGHASAWMLTGGRVRGGIHGAWPGLAADELRDGRALDHSIDYRDVLADVLTGHLGLSNVGAVIPDHIASPIGLL